MNKIIVLPLILLMTLSVVSACSCIYFPDTQAKYDNAAVVFSGEITNIQRLESYPVQQRVSFKINNVWKDSKDIIEKNSEIIIDANENDGANCGYTFEEGKYLVYAYIDQETSKIVTNSCMGTLKVEEAGNEIAELNKITPTINPDQNPVEQKTFWGKLKYFFANLFS